MTNHLNDDQIAAVLAGLEVEPDVRVHLDGCVACRRLIADFEESVAAQRYALLDDAPDFEAQRQAILASIGHTPAVVAPRRRGTRHTLLALAAAVVVALGVAALWPERSGDRASGGNDVPVATILEETEALLADDAIPGFEPIQWDAEDLGLGSEVPTPSTTS